MSIIEIENLNKNYQEQTVLKELSWSIEQGEVIALLGHNGAGKSTLLETIMGLREADGGSVNLWQKPWHEINQQHREKIAFVAQNCSGFDWMNVGTFLQYLGGFFSGWDEKYSQQLCQRWDLNPAKRLGELSGGQYQMVHVIHALSTRPEILILDEPVAHLDPRRRRDFIGELVDLCCERNTTAIFSSHIVSDLERVASKVALLKNGKIAHYHDLEDLKTVVAKVRFTAEVDLNGIPEIANLPAFKIQHNGAMATITEPLDYSLEALCQQHRITLQRIPISLEDWYLEVERDV